MNFSGILIGTEDPKRLRDYYSNLFGEPSMEEGGFSAWKLGTGYVSVGPHDQVTGKNAQPGRLIWNIETTDVQGEFRRLQSAGATVVKEPYTMDDEGKWYIATLSDPDDNYFQLVTPM